MKINKGKQRKPRRILMYGRQGLGKSTWAAQAPGVLFINLEDGIGDIDCASTDVLEGFVDVLACLIWLSGDKNEYQTIVIDSIDWLEQLIEKAICEQHSKKSIAEFDYGKGPAFVVEKWKMVLNGLNAVRAKGKAVILLAHSTIVKHSPPGVPTYEKYEPKLSKHSNALVQEWCDEVLFCTTKVLTRTEDQGFGKERNIAIEGSNQRIVMTTDTNFAAAKNRISLPTEMGLNFAEYAKHLANSRGNIEGVVVNGSSKKKEVSTA